MSSGADIQLVTAPIDPAVPGFAAEEGAEVRFLGVVRGTENTTPIRGIDYSAYEPMALHMMQQLRTEALALFGQHDLRLHHRLGFVAAEEPSIIIAVRTKHSAAAFEICQWYLAAVKKTVPIWKKMVPC